MNDCPWFYLKSKQRFGPISAEQLKQLLAAGTLAPNDLIWRDGYEQWVPASRIPGLFGVSPPVLEELVPAGYHYHAQGRQVGPVTFADLTRLVAAGQLKANDRVWQEGTPSWIYADQVLGLFPPNQPAPKPEPQVSEVTIGLAPPEPRFYFVENRQRSGPVSLEELRVRAARDLLRPDDMIFQEGQTKWMPARQLAGLFPQEAAKPIEIQMVQPAPVSQPMPIHLVPASEPVAIQLPPASVAVPIQLAPASEPIPIQLAPVSEAIAIQPAAMQEAAPIQLAPASEAVSIQLAPAAQAQALADSPAAAPANQAPASSGKGGPHPGNGLKVDDLIDKILQPGERFINRIAGELAGGWTTRSFIAGLTTTRLILIEKKFFSFAGEVAKEWIAYPLTGMQVSIQNYLLSSSVTINAVNDQTYTLNNVRKDDAKCFEEKFLELRDHGGEAPMADVGEIFMKAFRDRLADKVARGEMTQEMVDTMAKAAYRGFAKGQQDGVSAVVAEGVDKAVEGK